ncbi:MAG: beta-galactosidase [Planctomycetes bacterium]|nr:beta-galactosidase [Planctomycetota bacterium]
MTLQYGPINPKCPHFLHGGDYNPDQWTPDVWDQDMRLMKLAGCNAMSVGIFAWTALEPAEGRFEFGWLDTIMDKLADNGAFAVLATPSGARPAWMSRKYPEVLRVKENRVRNLHGLRHNHCPTSPVYRQKVGIINRRLAERYKDHPALLVWHISNEYGGECHCDRCQEAFRQWLRKRYNNDLDTLNHAWWTGFWSHTYTDFAQIESPAPHGEPSLHGLNLDWKRFTTDIAIDFYRGEIAPLRELTPDTPITTNFMGLYTGLNYQKFSRELDVVSWDSYPSWHQQGAESWRLGAQTAFVHDVNRCLRGGRPFMLMESVPSATNWVQHAKIKRPGMHITSSLNAVAHGSDTVQYFQWRKSRGGSEKFHGAVVDHCGHEHTRVFGEIAELGKQLARLDAVIGSGVAAEVAVVYDWENNWALNDAWGPKRGDKGYPATCQRHYESFWKAGVPVDVISMEDSFEGYKLLIAPMLYMVRPGVAERIEQFVKGGGVFVATYLTGIVDQTDLVFLGGWPGPLRKVLGIWAEEIDSLPPGETNCVVGADGNALGLGRSYEARDYCDLIHAESAEILATYGEGFYAGRPAVTVNAFGDGRAYYIASRNDQAFLDDFYGRLMADLAVRRPLEALVPQGVSVAVRTDGTREFLFVMNFTGDVQTIDLGPTAVTDMVSGQAVSGAITLPAFGSRVMQRG